jgi:preprotein translocase subunit Sec61beta
MATGVAGLKSGNHIVPYSQTTKRTEIIDLSTGIAASWSGAGTLTLHYATGYAYADSNDVWKLNFNIAAYNSVAFTSDSITIDGVVFQNASQGFQPLRTMQNGAPATNQCTDAYTANNGSTITVRHATANSAFVVSGDVILASEPTWASANLEASTDASVWIEPASSTQAGLLSYYEEFEDGSPTIADGGTTPSAVVRGIRIGKLVTISGYLTTGAAGTPTHPSITTVIPSAFRPPENLGVVTAWDADNEGLYRCLFQTSGSIAFYRAEIDSSGDLAYVNHPNAYTIGFSISYCLDI